MKNLTNLIIIAILALISTNSVSAFTQKDLNQYNQINKQIGFTKKRLKTLRRNVREFKKKRTLARNNNDKKSFDLYSAKLDSAAYQRFALNDDLTYLRTELESFDEIEDSNLIALN